MKDVEWQLHTACSVKVGDEIWFSSYCFNGLFRMNIRTGDTFFVDLFPNEETDVFFAHHKALYHEGLIIFAPWNGNNVHIYNIKEKVFVTIPVKKKYAEFAAGIAIIDDELFILPYYPMHGLLKVSLKTFEVNDVTVFDQKDYELSGITGTRARVDCAITRDHSILYAFQDCGKLFRWDVKEEKLSAIETGINIWGMFDLGDVIWLCDRNNKAIYKWIPKTENAQIVVGESSASTVAPRGYYSKILKFDNKIVAISRNRGQFVVVDEVNNVNLRTIEDDKELDTKNYIGIFESCEIVDDNLWLMPCGNDELLVFDKNLNQIDKKKFSIKGDECFKLWDKMGNNKYGCFIENRGLDLKNFIALNCNK